MNHSRSAGYPIDAPARPSTTRTSPPNKVQNLLLSKEEGEEHATAAGRDVQGFVQQRG